jgi:aspartyl-tRNA(Asn)/glutamyl-tRNA(Gln) amidotransferase subunit A
MLKSKEISATELVESVLQQIKEKEPDVGGYITVTEGIARKQAKAVDEKRARGDRLGALAGIPVAVKDNICTKGIKTTAASRILENFVPPYNATVIERLLASDAIIIGKTNLDEFAMGSSCENSALQRTRNPHDLSRVAGGSSGGSAAAVAANEAILALGSDTGGSVRLPAAFCGVVGLRPSYGMVSRYGLIALASSLDQIGPIAKTAEDAKLLFDVIAGEDPKDMTTISKQQPAAQRDIKSLTVGLHKEQFDWKIDSEIAKSVDAVIKNLEKHGATIKTVSVPHMECLLPLYYIMLTVECASNLARLDGVRYGYRAPDAGDVEKLYCQSRGAAFGDDVKRRVILGTFLSSAEFGGAYRKKALCLKRKIEEGYQRVFAECDLLISPMSVTPAFGVGDVVEPLKMYETDMCAFGATFAGVPAMSVPCGFTDSKLPIGVQLTGPRCSDRSLLSVAALCQHLFL